MRSTTWEFICITCDIIDSETEWDNSAIEIKPQMKYWIDMACNAFLCHRNLNIVIYHDVVAQAQKMIVVLIVVLKLKFNFIIKTLN